MTAHRTRPGSIFDEVTFIEVLFSGAHAPRARRLSGAWHPPTDVYETEEQVVVLVEVPGARADDFSVSLVERRLVISGMRYDQDVPRRAYHQMEIHFGEFRTEVDLPVSVEAEGVQAEYRDGLLRVTLPKRGSQSVPLSLE